MAENDDQDASQRTEEPTQRKLDEAFKKGQVVFSKEITNFLMIFTLVLVIGGVSPYLCAETVRLLRFYIEHAWHLPTDGASLFHLLIKGMQDFAWLLCLPALALVTAVLSSSMVQNKGFHITWDPIMPRWDRISPAAGVKRLFSMRSVMELLKGIVKIGIVGVAAYLAIKPYMASLKQLHTLSMGDQMHYLLKTLTAVLIAICIVMFFLALMDYLFQRAQFYKSLRMSKQDIKEEYKQTEGNPEVRAKLRSLRMNRAKSRMMAAVPKADVVITNPTHFSIALQYDIATMQAPIVVAKGVDAIALTIREVAKKAKVPLIENPPLARALYAMTEIGHEIPVEHYQAVAEIISYVFNQQGKKLG